MHARANEQPEEENVSEEAKRLDKIDHNLLGCLDDRSLPKPAAVDVLFSHAGEASFIARRLLADNERLRTDVDNLLIEFNDADYERRRMREGIETAIVGLRPLSLPAMTKHLRALLGDS